MGKALFLFAALSIASLAQAGAARPADTTWKTYTNGVAGFSISYPPGWKVDEHYSYVGFGPDHEIHGVAFEIPGRLAKGNNLSPNLTNLSVESVPGTTCDASRFLPNPLSFRRIRDAGRLWSTAKAQDAGAGNFYDIEVFALPGTSPCLAVRTIIHSTNIANYEPEMIRPFDREALTRTFAKIRRSIRIKPDRRFTKAAAYARPRATPLSGP